MIPKNITREHVLKAIAQIAEEGIPPTRHSLKWSVYHSGSLYPPKYVISIANRYANRKEWEPSKFSGGDEANEYLKTLGFEVVTQASKSQVFPFKSHSWRVLSDTVAVKELDKSSLLHHGTGIPYQVRPFFGLEEFAPTDVKEISLHYRGKEFSARFVMEKELKRIRLFWKADFADLLKRKLPDWYEAFSHNKEIPTAAPTFRIRKLNKHYSSYELELIYPSDISLDVESEMLEEQVPKREGMVKGYYGKRYERDPQNRAKAIEIHGILCSVCGFDFEERYGDRGRGFIEIHHTEPLSLLAEEQIVNPETDLVPVCPNCHRMIHRRRNNVLSIEELRMILFKE